MNKTMILASVLAVAIATPALANEVKTDEKAKHYFQKMDTDGNGIVSKAESDSFGQKMFDETDTNNDNALSLDELKAQKLKERSEWKEEKSAM